MGQGQAPLAPLLPGQVPLLPWQALACRVPLPGQVPLLPWQALACRVPLPGQAPQAPLVFAMQQQLPAQRAARP